ncbi:DegT/DnrJ/EryC1/StrS family aminotransferase [soil metagenome]
MAVPFINMKAVNNHLLEEFQPELDKIFESGQFVGGPVVQKFEEQFARYAGAKFGIGVNSGTDAILLALTALGIGPGDEVICSAYDFSGSADSIARLGAQPVFVDVRSDSYCVDPDQALATITSRTKAIIATHLFGHACEIDRLTTIARTYSVQVLEDMRHCVGGRVNGRRLGSFGAFGCFSFYPTRNLGAAGDGGLVSSNDEKNAETLRHLRDHGRNVKGEHEVIGYNSRLDAIQAALLSVKLGDVDENNQERIENARLYTQLFKGSPVVTPSFRDDLSHVYNTYCVLVPDRDKLVAHLTEAGIGHQIYYQQPLHLQPAFEYLGYKEGAFPVAEDLGKRGIALPIAPGLKKQHIKETANSLLNFYGVKA